jgi:hypothetical protein
LDRCICIAKKRTGARIDEKPFAEIPDFISRLGLRIVHGISRFDPLMSIRGTEHPATMINFYDCTDRFGRRRKVAWTTGSEVVGSLFLVIPDQDYDEIVSLVSELDGRQPQGEQFVAPNCSLPPSLNSTSSVRGSEDF